MILKGFGVFWLLLCVFIVVRGQNENILKESVKHFYTVEAKIDVVQRVSQRILANELTDKLLEQNIKIESSGGVDKKIKDLLVEDLVESKCVENLLRNENATFDSLKVSQSLKRQSEIHLSSFNALNLELTEYPGVFDEELQPIFETLRQVDTLIQDWNGNLTNFKQKEFKELIDETMCALKYMKPAQRILDAMKTLSADVVYSLFARVLPYGPCGTSITRSQAIMQFYDFIIIQVAKGELFQLKCIQMKELLTGVNLKDQKQVILDSIPKYIRSLYALMLNHIDPLIVPEVPLDYESPSNGCIVDLSCYFNGKNCNFNEVHLKDQWAPYTITTKHNSAENDEITQVTFESSCTLDFIPNDIFRIFTNLEILDVQSTKLLELEPEYFFGAHKLRTFYAQNNKIMKLKAMTFVYAQELISIHLGNNQIHDIDHQAFQGLSKLAELFLNNNSINALSFKVFRHLQKLHKLQMNGNNCTDYSSDYSGIRYIQTELEVESKCSQNDDIQKFKLQQNLQNRAAHNENIAENYLRTQETMQIKINSLENTQVNMFNKMQNMEESLQKIMKMLEKSHVQ